MKALVLQLMLQSAAVALPCTAVAQTTDYRITEATQARDRWDMVHASVENAKRGIDRASLGCALLRKGHEVRLVQRRADVSQVDFCTVDYVAGF